jgi:3-oxoacyl-[acyl-carrier-protein] synthase II
MGCVTPLGNEVDVYVDALLAGRSGIGPISILDPGKLPTRIAGESVVADAFAGEGMPFGDRKIAFALHAAQRAWEDACRPGTRPGEGESTATEEPGGVVSMGVGLELFTMDDLVRWRSADFELPADFEERLSFMQTPSDMAVHLVAHRYGLNVPPRVHVSACAAGTDAIGDAARLIARGGARFALAGGTDSMINVLGLAGFCALRAMSERNEAPERASRPFDRGRDGFVLGEGAGILVLEREADAKARGATVYAEVAGYGSSFDAFKISDPHPEGRGAYDAMRAAIADAGLTPGEIDAVNAHGTSTPKNDPAESLALEHLLGSRACEVPVSATKSMIGHLISAAGAVEAIAAIECMRRGVVHPTLNLDDPDPACRLDYVPHVQRAHEQRVVLSSSFGFGGHNAAIVLRRGDSILGRAAEGA